MTDRQARTEAMFRDICERESWWVSPDGRIGAADVERLLGWKEGTFESKRREGKAPPAFRIGSGRSKLTVRLDELAEWYEAQRD